MNIFVLQFDLQCNNLETITECFPDIWRFTNKNYYYYYVHFKMLSDNNLSESELHKLVL